MKDIFINGLFTLILLHICIIVHELGHLYAGKALGFHPLICTFGNGHALYSKVHGNVLFRFSPLPYSGGTYFSSIDDRLSWWRHLLMKLAGPAANVLLGTFVYFLSASLVPGVNDAFREEPTRIAKAAASDLIRVSALPFVVAEKVLTLDIPDNSQGQDAMTIHVTESVPGSGVYSVTDGRGNQIDEFDIGPDYSGRADHFEKKIQQSIDEQLVEPASQESYSGTISGYLNRLAAISLLVGSFNLLPFPGSDGFGAACSAVNGAVSKIRRRKWQLPEQIESMGWTQFIPLCIGLVVLLNLRQLLGYL